MFVRPWNKESEKYLFQLAKERTLFTRDINFTRSLGRRYPELSDNGFMDIGRIDKKHESIIALRPGIGLAPLPTRRKFMKFQLYRLF